MYYNYRYYSPALGRWISRDPIEEKGDKNIYVMIGNRLINEYDSYGLVVVPVKGTIQCERNGIPLSLYFSGSTLLSNLGDFAIPAVSGKPVMESERFGEIYGPYPSVRFPVSSHSSMYYIQQVHRAIEFDYSVARQKLKGIGPIPEDEYWFNVKYKRNWRSFVSHIVGREGWGDYSWSLTAEPSTMFMVVVVFLFMVV